jgi:hypothetical protein
MSQENVEVVRAVYDAIARRSTISTCSSRSTVSRMSGRGSRSGVPVAQQGAVLVTFDGSTLVSGKSFASKGEALEAAGLRPALRTR